MALNNYDQDPFDREDFQEEYTPEPEKKSGNRTFLTVIIVLGLVFLVALLALIIFAPKYIASQREAQMQEAALINAANTATAMAVVAQQDELNTAGANGNRLDPHGCPHQHTGYCCGHAYAGCRGDRTIC